MNATNKQKGAIHALGARCGLYEKGNKRDGLHAFVYQLTLKLSIAELTSEEAERVIKHLQQNLEAIQGEPLPPMGEQFPPNESNNNVNYITEYQTKKIFGLMYELTKYDSPPSPASPKQRIAGAMSKVLGISVNLKSDIFKGITFEQGTAVIEELKRYVRNAKRKAAKR